MLPLLHAIAKISKADFYVASAAINEGVQIVKLLAKPHNIDNMYGPYDIMDTNLRHSTFGPLNPLFWPTPPHVLNQLINYQRQLWPIPPATIPDTPKSCRISPLNYTTESLT
ncbi:unnamed protein product [Diamesa hyperborea]